MKILIIILLLCILSIPLSSHVEINHIGTSQRLTNGNTLICDGGLFSNHSGSKILEVDPRGSLVWVYIKGDIVFPHSAQKLANGNILISDTGHDRIIEVDRHGSIVWTYDTNINVPNDADRLSNGNTLITVKRDDKVIEVNPSGTVVWSYTQLNRPHNADRLSNGNTMISNSDDNEVLEVDSLGNIVWSFSTGLDWPRDADRLANGNTLISDSHNGRVIEVTPGGTIVWSYTVLNSPYEADRLSNGNTLISDIIRMGVSQVLEVDSSGTIVWRYPETVPTVVDTVWIYNPSSGCTLFVNIHRPTDATPANPFPGVIMIPGGNETGITYDTTGLANRIADDGFICVHFDPDGRGNSTNNGTYTIEDYCGYIQQDGLWEIVRYLYTYPYIDTTSIGFFTESYGVTMASGVLSRHTNDPYIKFLLDWEGPSDRYQTCQDSGGHVPVPPDSQSFWIEREAALFMKSANVYYLRVQSTTDHNPNITDNSHAIALIDSGTATTYGGSGICPWTRVNDSLMNIPNTIYTIGSPPEWILETLELYDEERHLIFLHELASKPVVSVEEGKDEEIPDLSHPFFLPSIVRSKENTELRLSLTASQDLTLQVYDVCGRVSQNIFKGSLPEGDHRFSINFPQSGIYFLTLKRGTLLISEKVIVLH